MYFFRIILGLFFVTGFLNAAEPKEVQLVRAGELPFTGPAKACFAYGEKRILDDDEYSERALGRLQRSTDKDRKNYFIKCLLEEKKVLFRLMFKDIVDRKTYSAKEVLCAALVVVDNVEYVITAHADNEPLQWRFELRPLSEVDGDPLDIRTGEPDFGKPELSGSRSEYFAVKCSSSIQVWRVSPSLSLEHVSTIETGPYCKQVLVAPSGDYLALFFNWQLSKAFLICRTDATATPKNNLETIAFQRLENGTYERTRFSDDGKKLFVGDSGGISIFALGKEGTYILEKVLKDQKAQEVDVLTLAPSPCGNYVLYLCKNEKMVFLADCSSGSTEVVYDFSRNYRIWSSYELIWNKQGTLGMYVSEKDPLILADIHDKIAAPVEKKGSTRSKAFLSGDGDFLITHEDSEISRTSLAYPANTLSYEQLILLAKMDKFKVKLLEKSENKKLFLTLPSDATMNILGAAKKYFELDSDFFKKEEVQ